MQSRPTSHSRRNDRRAESESSNARSRSTRAGETRTGEMRGGSVRPSSRSGADERHDDSRREHSRCWRDTRVARTDASRRSHNGERGRGSDESRSRRSDGKHAPSAPLRAAVIRRAPDARLLLVAATPNRVPLGSMTYT